MPDEIDYSKTAWGDESVRITANPSFYAMAACVIDANALRLPLELMYLKPKSAKKLHWRELDDRGRKRALKVISEHPPKTVIVAAAPIIRNKQERARRK
ncbi:MAG: hypothetical protein IJ087_03930, partial [Eggerthellaceae bacterium]|nr:hypothetical protein [Eggerthellaceae bacterium]